MNATETTDVLMTAVKRLAGVCDGAHNRDDHGFNAYDSAFGKSLAHAYKWTANQRRAAWKMLRKYKGQLHGMGIDYDAIPEPPLAIVAVAGAPVSPSPVKKSPIAVMRRIDLSDDGSRLWVTFPYEPTIVSAVKNIPCPKIFNGESVPKRWELPVADVSIETLEMFAHQFSFTFGEKCKDAITSYHAVKKEAIAASSAADADLSHIDLTCLNGTLRPFQKAGVAYAIEKKRTFIADEMGLGKTVQALATVQIEKAFPALVICPASLKLNWYREATKWLKGREVKVLRSKDEISLTDILQPDLYIVNYDIISDGWMLDPITKKPVLDRYRRKQIILSNSMKALKTRGIKAIIMDESHYIKSHKTQRAVAVKELAKDVPIRLALTGTPVMNRPIELAAQLAVIDRLTEFGGWYKFSQQYCGAYSNGFGGMETGGHSHLKELNEKLRATCFTGDTVVLTEYGKIPIRKIVEERLSMRVWSCDPMGRPSLQSIVGFNEKSHSGVLVKVEHEGGSFTCTREHLIFTQEGYIRADELTSQHILSTMREDVSERDAGHESDLSVLRNPLFRTGPIRKQGCYCEINGNKITEEGTRHYQNLSWMRRKISSEESTMAQRQKVLLSILQQSGSLSNSREGSSLETSGGDCTRDSIKNREAESKIIRGTKRKNYTKTSEACHVAIHEENLGSEKIRRAECLFDGGQKRGGCSKEKTREGASAPCGSSEISRRVVRLSDRSRVPNFLRGSNTSSIEDHDRGGWPKSLTENPTGFGQSSNPNLYGSRVLRTAILEVGNRGEPHQGGQGSESVYDIEVEGNHNFFANGVLVHNCFVRRLKKDVLKELPAKQNATVWLDIDNRREYDRAEADLIQWLVSQGKLEKAARASKAEELARIEVLKQLCVKGKMAAAVEWIDSFLESGEKLIMFATHREVAMGLAEKYKAPLIIGGISDAKKQEAVDKFQLDPTCKMIVLNILAGGVGLTLTAASNVAFIELGWNPAQQDQCIDRAHRMGQTDEVTGWHLISERTIDVEIMELIENKRSVVNAATDGADSEVQQSILSELVDRLKKKAA